MAQIIKEITVDVAKKNLFQAIVAKQNDSNSRFLKCTLLNEGAQIIVPSSATAIINAERADDTSAAFMGTVNEDGTVTVPLTGWMLALDDIVRCSISVIDSDDQKLTSTSFSVEVESVEFSDSDISQDENYDILINLISDCSDVKVDCENAAADALSATTAAARATESANTAATAANAAAAAASDISDYYGSPLVATTAAGMTQTNRVYVYTGSETGYTVGNWYYYNGSAWVSGGVYNSATLDGIIITDTDNQTSYRMQFRLMGGKPAIEYNEV